MGITAVIPVRAGSKRIKDKNIRPFAGKSLLEIKIEQLKEVPQIDQIVVSSDSDIMLELAQKLDVVAKKRPAEYCDEKSKSFNDVVKYIAYNHVETESIMWVPCVCPLLKTKSILDGLKVYDEITKGIRDNDSVATALLLHEYVFDENGPINFSIEKHVPSQYLPNWHTIQNGFFIAKTQQMYDWGFVYGKKPYLKELDKIEAIDIDEMVQFKMAEYLFMSDEWMAGE